MKKVIVDVSQDDGGVEVTVHYDNLSIPYRSLRQEMKQAIQEAYDGKVIVFHGTHICTANNTSYSYVKIDLSNLGEEILDRLLDNLKTYKFVEIKYQ